MPQATTGTHDPDTHDRRMRRRTRRARRITAVGAITAAAAAGCRDTAQQTAAPDVRASRSWVVGVARNDLDVAGRFKTAGQASGPGELSAQQAVELATTFVHTYGRRLAGPIASRHRAPVDVGAVQPCGRAFHAAARYTAGEGASPALVGLLAPRWIVTLCANGTPAVSVSLTATATQLTVIGGHIRGPLQGDFLVLGIPLGTTPGPLTPEAAVRAVHDATGGVVSAVPDLVLPENPVYAAQYASWHLTLDTPVHVRERDTGAPRVVRDVYVRGGGAAVPQAVLDVPTLTAPTPQVVADHMPHSLGVAHVVLIPTQRAVALTRAEVAP